MTSTDPMTPIPWPFPFRRFACFDCGAELEDVAEEPDHPSFTALALHLRARHPLLYTRAIIETRIYWHIEYEHIVPSILCPAEPER